MITISCQGDNNWERTFPDADAANEFLYSLIGRAAAFGISSKEPRSETQPWFDLEDDLLIWSEGEFRSRQQFYGCGEHHSSYHGTEKRLLLPDGQRWEDVFQAAHEADYS